MSNNSEFENFVVQFFDYPITSWEIEDGENIVPNTLDNEGPPIRKLFVGNINRRSTYRDLIHLFSVYGKVKDAHVSRSKYTNTKKSYGFVTFVNPEDAATVLKLQKGELQLHKRTLYVAAADIWHQPKELPDGTVLWNSRDKQNSLTGTEESEDGITTESRSASVNSEDEEGAVGVSSSNFVYTSSATSTPEEHKVNNDSDIREEDCKIHMLNNDCLMHVFSYLSKRERIKIERVCKRWQDVCWNMWLSQKHLDLTSVFHSGSQKCINWSILSSFLKRCGQNLKSLDLSHKPYDLGKQVTKLISKYCQHLENLNVGGLPISGHSLRILYPVVEELRVLSLDGCHGAAEKDMQSFFYRCKSLQSLVLSRHHNLTGKCLLGLANSPLQQLVLDDCNNLRSKFLIRGLSALSGLTDLSLNSCINLTSSDVSEIVAAVPGLLRLSMNRYFPLFSSSTLHPLSMLHNLINLDLQLNQVVNDQVMSAISKGCLNIRRLNVTGCSINSWEQPSLTDEGLCCISNLPHLVDLSMSYLANVSDESLIAIAKKGRIRKLECRGCPTFTDAGSSRIVTSCNELELFDFSGCDVITETTVKAALEAVKLRSNNIKLVLIVGGSSVSHLEKLETHPLLEVDTKDFCIAHLRPDFVDEIYFPPSENDDDDDDYDYDGLCDFDWETHSLVFGDDIEYYKDFFCDDDDDDTCGHAHLGFYC